MTVENFIKQLAKATKDENNIVISQTEWIDIVGFCGSEMSPEVLFRNTASLTWGTDITDTTYQYTMSDSTYEGIDRVNDVKLVDSDGEQIYYDNWIYDKNTNVLDLNPSTNVDQDIVPSSSYPTIKVEWLGHMPDVTGASASSTINLNKAELNLFKKICIKESLKRTLLDHTKLDRYRTLVGRMNEYALLAIIRDYTAEIEMEKRKLANSNTVRSF